MPLILKMFLANLVSSPLGSIGIYIYINVAYVYFYTKIFNCIYVFIIK